MHDASVERLARLITDSNSDAQDEGKFRKPDLHLAEGWFSLVLVGIVLYSTIFCVQAAGWVEHLDRLTFITALGLACGVLASKQRRFPSWALHIAVFGIGVLLAYWQTASAFFGGDGHLFWQAIQHWLAVVNSGGATDDDSIFLFFIIGLSFLLAYTSAWLVYRTRSPWLMIVANAVVILINLNNAQDGNIIFLVVFLMAALLLLLRFNLYESVVRWRRMGLRYAEDIGWDFMQAGALISIGILVFSWILPGSYIDPFVSQMWNASGSPLVVVQNAWDRVLSVDGASSPSNHGSFQKDLTLGGNPHLTNQVVMLVESSDSKQYLGSLAYDTYTGRGWTNTGSVDDTLKVPKGFSYSSGALMTHQVKQKISIVNAPQGSYPFIFGASEIEQVSLPTKWLVSTETGSLIAWVGQDAGVVTGNTSYSVVSDVSSADVETLKSVPLPKNAPAYANSSQYSEADQPISPNAYNPSILQVNTALPKGMNPEIARLAQRITANAPTMYDKVVALENYLRQNYTYSLDVQLPAGREGVSWFLFDSKKGFCNYFASAMAVMTRSLGIPARVEVGYTNGAGDSKDHQQVVHGVDAHAWTQVYFAGYGWINFEPSGSFSTFSRPLANQYKGGAGNSAADLTGNLGAQVASKFLGKDPESTFDGGVSGGVAKVNAWQQEISVALGSLALLFLLALLAFGVWWSRLFRGYSASTQVFGRIYLLANWAGVKGDSSLTPYEYSKELAVIAPGEELILQKLSDIYVRDRWADPESLEHPARSGEMQELPGMWRALQPKFFWYVVRHPSFLYWLPRRIVEVVKSGRGKRRQKREWKRQDL